MSRPRALLFGAGIAVLALLGARATPGALAQQPAGSGSLTIANPADGAVVRTTNIPVRIVVSNYTLACDEAGAPDRDGTGHIHVMLDGMTMAQLTNFYCAQDFWISGQGLEAGQHVLTVDLATNAHGDLMDTAKSVTFLFQPSTAPPDLPAPRSFAGAAVAITSPADGATVGPQFNLAVQPSNFAASCDLEGKRNVAGFGHYHVFVDMDPASMMMPGGDTSAMDMEMMDMPGMIGMPCSNTIPVDLSAWASGQHTISVELDQNDHTPVMDAQGLKFATITINLENPFRP